MGEEPKRMKIVDLKRDAILQKQLLESRNCPMTITGFRQSKEKEHMEPHEMIVLHTDGVNFTIYDQSAAQGHNIIKTNLTDMTVEKASHFGEIISENEVATDKYFYKFSTIWYAEHFATPYNVEDHDELQTFMQEQQVALVNKLTACPPIGQLFREVHQLEQELEILSIKSDLDFAVLYEKLAKLRQQLDAL
jgi:hypothetical protein